MSEGHGFPRFDGPVVLVPVKAFHRAKARLAPTIGPGPRAELARAMASHVLAAAAPLPVAVVCDDAEVARWARLHGATVILEPGRGLNGAVEEGVRRLGEHGATEVVVAHSDLPQAEGLAGLAGFAGVTLVPDRHDDGTNVICVPIEADFHFSYGPASFARHRREVRRLSMALRVLRTPSLRLDVDVPADVAAVPGSWSGP